MYSQDQNASLRICGEDLPRRVQPVQVRHSDIEQQNVRLQLAGVLDGFAAVPGFATYFPSRMIFQQRANAFSSHFVAIRNKNSNRAQTSPPRKTAVRARLVGGKFPVWSSFRP